MKKMIGRRVTIKIDHFQSRFNGKKGTVKYKSDLNGKWFVHLDGDPKGNEVEFSRNEMVIQKVKP